MLAVVDQRPVVMGMHIDEAGGEDAARAVEGDLGLDGSEIADGADAVALDGDIGPKAGAAAAVDHLGMADDEIRAQGEDS